MYGTLSMEQIMLDLQQSYPDVYFTYYQSNHEGDLIDRLQEPLEQVSCGQEPVTGVVLNAGGYTHTRSLSPRIAADGCVCTFDHWSWYSRLCRSCTMAVR